MRKRTFILLGVAVLGPLILITVFTKPAEQLAVSVVFTGYTNDSNGTPLAAFSISNDSQVNVRHWNWYNVEVPTQILPAANIPLRQIVILTPGKRDVFMIPVPTNIESWRVVVICSQYGVRQKFADWANRSGYWRYLPKSLTGVLAQYAKSEWIKR